MISLPGVSGLTRAKSTIPHPPARPAMSLTLEGAAPRCSRRSRTRRSCSSVSRKWSR